MYNLQKYGNNITNTYFKEDKMEASKLKNMVVLKNLPSNIVDEAIIVLKANKKVKKLQKIEKDKLAQEKEEKKEDVHAWNDHNLPCRCGVCTFCP